MEPTNSDTPQGAAVSGIGELVVQNGRLSGARRPLNDPVTMIGRAEGCDVRLNVDGVNPLHCVLVRSVAGVVLRDMDSHGGTLVNGGRVTVHLLCDGDLLTVGPFRFRLRLPALAGAPTEPVLSTTPTPETAHEEKEALRVQAAAVVAQQAGLTEEEGRLEQRRVALERHEEQLATHLEEKRRKLLELQEQVREARTALRSERTVHEEQSGKLRQDAERARREVAAGQQKIDVERKRLSHLRRRLRLRWHRHWDVEQAGMQRREATLAAEQRLLEKASEQFHKDKEAFTQARMRFNGEIELGRRQLQDGWQHLREAQQQWQAQCAQEQAELAQRRAEQEEREATLRDGQQELAVQLRHWDSARRQREQEAEGLENRIRNQRRKMHEQEQEVARLDGLVRAVQRRAGLGEDAGRSLDTCAPSAAPASAPAIEPVERNATVSEEEASYQQRLAALEKLSAELADQRLHLAEQFARLLRSQHQWHEDHESAAAELEAAARRIEERERGLAERERTWEFRECGLRQRSEEVGRMHLRLEAWQVRLAAREKTAEGERDRLLNQVQTSDELLQQQQTILGKLRERWAQRRRREVADLHAERTRCEELRVKYLALWEECLHRSAVLEQEQRGVAERALAMEQYRLEIIGQAAHTPAAERRLERLRRRCAAIHVTAARKLAGERQALEAEALRLEVRAQYLEQYGAKLLARESTLSAERIQWDEKQQHAESSHARMRQELKGLLLQRQQHQRELAELREELERVANALMDTSSQGEAPPTVQAA